MLSGFACIRYVPRQQRMPSTTRPTSPRCRNGSGMRTFPRRVCTTSGKAGPRIRRNDEVYMDALEKARIPKNIWYPCLVHDTGITFGADLSRDVGYERCCCGSRHRHASRQACRSGVNQLSSESSTDKAKPLRATGVQDEMRETTSEQSGNESREHPTRHFLDSE